jgi:hypothetical protein
MEIKTSFFCNLFIFAKNRFIHTCIILEKRGFRKKAEKATSFWKDVFLSLSELKHEKAELIDIQQV